ncbi:serine/threonine-protein kinase HipA [Methylopila capsulata]|uniref:Serine/threonine-protein kinase HipA n=1 Tax=Methylopila capsulata TaxID=61654 RepID=A0A9W6MQG1_9HYPH|nr:type II toxin-antitoxin system HipA family toxin [Methylopila capsulata]MBM7851120.1 serine/threonine-protein kinase HipA [Methylopila capsulata]GLK54177.1 toxin HipA [Methylopila capsulata]
MARRPASVPLNVFLNSRHVGVLRREPSGAIEFRYAQSWLEWEAAFPISRSLLLREDRYVGDAVSNVFDNLLPDSLALRTRIAERVGATGIDAYSLLRSLGRDCVGALQFLPDGEDPGPAGEVHAEPMTEDDVARLVANLGQAPLGVGPDGDFRISLAGAQEKTALLRIRDKWFKPVGATATTHILKPEIGPRTLGVDFPHSVENEHFCLRLMAAFGLPVAETEIAEFGGRRTLVVQRFDRYWRSDGKLLRLPQEDICQALSVPQTLKYQSEGGPGAAQVVDLMKASDTPQDDVATFLRALVAFWLIGATDGHAKNFSIFLAPGGRFRMTPLYDVLTAQPTVDAGLITRNQFKLAMSAGKSRHYRIDTIAPRHFLETATEAGVGGSIMRAILDDLAENALRLATEVVDKLPAGFPEELTASVLSAIRRRADLLSV